MTESTPTATPTPRGEVVLGWAVVLGMAAGGLGWGIRGQYGHETGAMIAGVLVGFVAVMLYLPRAASLAGARVVALTALGVSFGGSMTYGRTVGLTHGPGAVGHWDALLWGMLGLAIKGGIWFGFAGVFLGMGMGRVRYRWAEGLVIVGVMLVLLPLGIWALNLPYRPLEGVFPRWYFSGEGPFPAGPDPKARREVWGGLLFALAGVAVWTRLVRGDRLAGRMAVVGFVAGAVGFPAGQCWQAYHAWNLPSFREGWFGPFDRLVNWWNLMEITFGAVAGGGLIAGLAWNRALIADDPDEPVAATIAPGWEVVLAVVHAGLIAGSEFSSAPVLRFVLAYGPVAALIALPAILGGRWWPYLFALPIVALPIAGKTLRNLGYEHAEVSLAVGWTLLLVAPLLASLSMAVALGRAGRKGQPAERFAAWGLLFATWLYFSLNFAFFRLPWPWASWTARTPSAAVKLVCAGLLTAASLNRLRPGTRTGRVDVAGE